MSVTNDNDIYEKIVAGVVQEGISSDYSYLKYDDDEDKIINHDEEAIDQNRVFLQSSDHEILEEIVTEKQNQYFETVPSSEETESIEEQHYEISLSNIKDEWSHTLDNTKEAETVADDFELADDDEETIAIFATAAGQELALYRVDGSDEIYAVSLFDESGEPPTNFEYLMSSDVERLIKQGAVRIVKKPSGLKNQLVATPSPVMLREQTFKQTYDYKPKPKYKDTRPYKTSWNSSVNYSKYNKYSNPHTIVDKQPDVNYVLLDSTDKEEYLEEFESEEEVIQQSTVQYLLCDDEQSDSELTFDDIRNTLENIKGITKSPPKTDVKKKPEESTNGLIATKSAVQRHSVRPNIMQTHRKSIKNNVMDPKLNYLKEGYSTFAIVEDFGDQNKKNSVPSTPAEKLELKVKRPRKQKLTSVNRGDSEIIIQPASMIDEEEETPVKKRNKRKRKVLPDPDYNPRTPTRKMRKMRKHSRVEVIDIDLDEENNQDTIEEITIDDGKEKNSSDKENNIIMVGDSDEDSQESNEKNSSSFECQFCSRNFRQRRLLDTHTRICSKAHTKKAKKISDSGKKEFTCKTCKEKFDAAVSLARHVRANHTQKRGRPRKIIQVPVNDEDDDDTDEIPASRSPEKVQEKLTKEREIKEPTTQKVTRSATKENKRTLKPDNTKKISKRRITKKIKSSHIRKMLSFHCCSQCSKIVSSLKELRVHYLQHVTKSSMHCCKKCRRIAPSKKVLLRHIKKTHKKKKPVKSCNSKVKEKLIKEEQPPVTPRKRGRPRKVKPID